MTSQSTQLKKKIENIGVVIVNFNSGSYLQVCLRSLCRTRFPLDIVIVDNNSTDGSTDFYKKLFDKTHNLKLIKNEDNRGFAVAVNQGALALKNRYITLLNPDCLVFPTTLPNLMRALSSNRDAAIAGALVFNEDGSEQRGCRRREPTLKRSMVTSIGLGSRLEGINMSKEPIRGSIQEVDAVSGAAMMVRREHFERIGGMDEGYFLHCEDLDICRKARNSGLKVLFCANAIAIHRQGASTGVSSARVEKHKHAGMIRYNKIHHSKGESRWQLLLVNGLVQGHYLFGRIQNLCMETIRKWPRVKDKNHNRGNNPAKTERLTDTRHPMVLITGGKSDVGDYLIEQLSESSFKCVAVARSNTPSDNSAVQWLNLEFFTKVRPEDFGEIDTWINLAPIWTTRTLFKVFGKFNPKKIIALSSTSITGKAESEGKNDQEVVEKLSEGESWVKKFSDVEGRTATIIRPTLIYGGPRNQNINFIQSFVRTLRFFPIIGNGQAKRQPVHAEDVATTCRLLLNSGMKESKVYTIAGGEVLTYRQMVSRVFEISGIKERILSVPLGVVRIAIQMVNWIPGLRFLDPEMASRMEKDLVHSNSELQSALSVTPRPFQP